MSFLIRSLQALPVRREFICKLLKLIVQGDAESAFPVNLVAQRTK